LWAFQDRLITVRKALEMQILRYAQDDIMFSG